jgi:NodT family efflux transporter outer membrane factor (OMF) lipoprotein
MNSRFLLAGAFALLSGCALPPKDQPKEILLADSTLALDGGSTPAIDAQWWKTFNDPQLDALIEQVLSHNPRLSEAVSRVRGARADIEAAQAGNQPGFSFDGSIARDHFPEHYLYPPPLANGDYWNGQLTANLNWDLDFWGRQAALIERAKARAQAAAYDAAAARLAIAGALAQDYIHLYRAEALAAIATQAEQQRQSILQLTQHRVTAGLDTDVELHAAEAALPQARLAREQSLAAAELSRHELAALAGEGTAAYSHFQSPKPNLEAALPLPDRVPADLLAHRPDVLAAKARVLAATQGRVAAHQAFYPDVNLSAFAGQAAFGLGNLFRSDSAGYGAGPAIHLPLFDSQRLKAGYRAATADLDAATDEYNATVLNAVQQAADQLTLVQSTTQQLDDSKRLLAATEASYQLAQRRYAAGLGNYLSVLNAETQALEARRNMVDVLAAKATARVALVLTLGGSFETLPAAANHAAANPISTTSFRN